MKLAATLIIIQGLLMELGTFIGVGILYIVNPDALTDNSYFKFIVPYFNENMLQMIFMSLIFGILRLTGAFGLYKKLQWGLVLSIINCTVTMVLMIFMLPAGIMDGLLSASALVLILLAFYGKKEFTLNEDDGQKK